MKKIILFTLISILITNCSSIDPTGNDLKSPCVANDNGLQKTPCIRRKSLENIII